ncbi:MAG: hypothetical protein ACYDAE_01710, partial [Steroidobacteraceae bacterium]
ALLAFSQSLCAGLERASKRYEAEKSAHDQLDSLARGLTAGRGNRELLRTVEKLRDATAEHGDEGDPGAISGRLAGIEADAESADLAPTPADEEVLKQESKALDQAERESRGNQAAIRKLNVRLRRAHLPVILPCLRCGVP